MMDMSGADGEKCPFDLNFDPQTFKAGDLVSYRVDDMMDMPFVGILVDIHDDHVTLAHYDGTQTPQGHVMRGTKADRPVVKQADAIE